MRRLIIPLAVLAAVAIAVAGCGGGGGGGGGNGSVSVAIQGPAGPLTPGSVATITASVTGATSFTSVTWSIVEGSVGGALSNVQANSVTYTAPNVGSGTFHVKATSIEDPSKNAIATITMQPGASAGITVVVNGPTGSLFPGDAVQITATVSGSVNKAVIWSVVEGEPAGGTLSNKTDTSVTYTSNVEGVFHVKAVSKADPTKSDQAAITVSINPPPPPAG